MIDHRDPTSFWHDETPPDAFESALQTANAKTKNPDRGYIFGIKTITGEFICQTCMKPNSGQLDGCKIEELKERSTK